MSPSNTIRSRNGLINKANGSSTNLSPKLSSPPKERPKQNAVHHHLTDEEKVCVCVCLCLLYSIIIHLIFLVAISYTINSFGSKIDLKIFQNSYTRLPTFSLDCFYYYNLCKKTFLDSLYLARLTLVCLETCFDNQHI